MVVAGPTRPATRIAFVLIDGIGDVSIPSLGNRTPLQAARTPNLDAIASAGVNGLMDPVEPGLACGRYTLHCAALWLPRRNVSVSSSCFGQRRPCFLPSLLPTNAAAECLLHTNDPLSQDPFNPLPPSVPPSLPPSSDTAHLSLLGYDPRLHYRGRGAFESMGAGIPMSPGDIAFKVGEKGGEERRRGGGEG